jgi:hypothetical protein
MRTARKLMPAMIIEVGNAGGEPGSENAIVRFMLRIRSTGVPQVLGTGKG